MKDVEQQALLHLILVSISGTLQFIFVALISEVSSYRAFGSFSLNQPSVLKKEKRGITREMQTGDWGKVISANNFIF